MNNKLSVEDYNEIVVLVDNIKDSLVNLSNEFYKAGFTSEDISKAMDKFLSVLNEYKPED